MINLIAVRSSPSIAMSENAGIHTKFFPLGATNPLAIATALIAWLSAPAPTACISTVPFSLKTFAKAPNIFTFLKRINEIIYNIIIFL